MRAIVFVVFYLLSACSEESISNGTRLSTTPRVKKIDKLAVSSGEIMTVEGLNLKKSIVVTIADQSALLELSGSTKATLTVPESAFQGTSEISFAYNGKSFASFPILINAPVETVETSALSPEQVCEDVLFKNPQGVLTQGTRNCVAVLEECSSAGELDCRTVAAYPSMDKSDPLLVPANIRNGITIAGVSGTYPSAAAPLTGSTLGLADLSSLGTATPVGNYEFFDSKGARYTGAIADGGTITPGTTDQTISATNAVYRQVVVRGDLNLTPINIKDAVTLFAVTGALTGAPANCSSDGQASCLVDGTTYAAGLLAGAAAKIRSGSSLAGVSGNVTLPAVGNVLSGTSYGVSGTGSTGTLTLPVVTKVLSPTAFGVAGTGSTGTLTLPLAANVKTGTAVYGEPGSQLTPAYSPDFPSVANVRSLDTVDNAAGTLGDCSAANQSGCVATTTYKTMDLSLAGVTTDLTAANFNTSVATAANFEFWDSTGARSVVSGTSNLSLGNVKSGVTIFGVTGDYPSATYTLPSASTTADLDAATFDAKAKSATAFEYWSSAGSYQTGAGDADIIDSNIVSTATIFGLTGNLTAPASIDTWNVRLGSVINGVTGGLETSCRNRGNASIWDAGAPYTASTVDATANTLTITGHPFTSNITVRVGASTEPTGITIDTTTYYVIYVDANTIKLSAASGPGAEIDITAAGANVTVYQWGDGTLDWWDSIDDYNNNTGFPTGWINVGNDCTYSNWQDLTADGSCNAAADDCIMKDKISGLMWSESYPVNGLAAASTNLSWQKAIQHCNYLSFGGYSDWRLATQKELMEAYIHSIRDVGYNGTGAIRFLGSEQNNDQFILDVDANFWSASAVSNVAVDAWHVYLGSGTTNANTKSTAYKVLCVR